MAIPKTLAGFVTVGTLLGAGCGTGAYRPGIGSAGARTSTSTVASSSTRALEPAHFDYDVELTSDRRRLVVHVCPGAGSPGGIAIGDAARGLVVEAWQATTPSARSSPQWRRPSYRRGHPLPIAGRHLSLGQDDRWPCIGYAVDLVAAARRARFGSSSPSVLIVPVAWWLLSPSPPSLAIDARLVVALPPGQSVSLPFRKHDGTYRLDSDDFRHLAYSAFGELVEQVVDAPGARLTVVRPRASALTGPTVERWIGGAARAASLLLGRFPVDRAQVILVPFSAPGAGPSDRAPVAFGHVGRGGGASMAFLVRDGASAAALEEDWVAAHEFTHLAMPHLPPRDAWFSEGFATYYQEVLRGRAGLRDEAAVLHALADGFRRGSERGTGRTLRRESQDMFQTHAFERVYWAGAALFFSVDMALRFGHGDRVATGGVARDRWVAEPAGRLAAGDDGHPPSIAVVPRSLDALISSARDCVAPKRSTAQALIACLDGHLPEPVLGHLLRDQLDRSRFPDTSAAFAALGLGPTGLSSSPADGAAAARRADWLRTAEASRAESTPANAGE